MGANEQTRERSMPKKRSEGVRKDQTTSKPRKTGKPASSKTDVSALQTQAVFPIVGIGASAGGLDAFEKFFTNMPSDTGMAFVLVQHLDPTHKSILSQLITRYTRMKVLEVEDGILVEPNSVFVIPPNRYMGILNGKLHLLEPTSLPGHRTPIDYFFRTLAEDQKENAICIVLSGTGTEGTLGLRAIKGEGGMGMVQDPESAKYDGMPRNAITTGLADYILPVEAMPEQLIAYARHAIIRVPGTPARVTPKEADHLEKIFMIVRSQKGHDFSHYKKNTVLRRIERRMAVNRITDLSRYVRYVQEQPAEADTLFKDLLIGVTNFFRDKEAFDVLRERVIPKLFENRNAARSIRIWVPGCATGEEPYTIAILCRDFMRSLKDRISVQIFATDLNDEAIETARLGNYPESIANDVPAEFLDRYFTKEGALYRVKKEIRDMVVFALQNVISDPPFSRIDLVTCRNLLIYLGAELQKKVLPLFHYALNPNAFLFLGSSESVGEFTELFSVLDRKWRLYTRNDTESGQKGVLHLNRPTATDRRIAGTATAYPRSVEGPMHREVVEQLIMERYGPAGVLISEKGETLYIHGRTGKYLEPASGDFAAKSSILDMARPGLKIELARSIRKAVTQKAEIRFDRLRVKTNGGESLINLVVKPIVIPASKKGQLLVLFEDVPLEETHDTESEPNGSTEAEEHPRIRQLEHELLSTKEYLQSTIEELETSNEELQSTNEELQSSNEELQSTNEELETSKEELQSVNEELNTVNSELQQNIEELTRTSNDLNNLLASTNIGTIFLDTFLNVQRFTPTMTDFINLIQTDVGRPLAHIVTKLKYGKLVEDAQEVLRTLVAREQEIQTNDDRWYSMRILPYRTVENVIDGVVITFVDTSVLRRALKNAAEEAERQEVSIINTVHEPVLLLDRDMRIESANEAFYRSFKVKPNETKGKLLYDLANREWDIPALRDLLETILPEKTSVEDFTVEHEFETIGHRTMRLNARQLQTEPGRPEKILLAIEDITGQHIP
jgi:two-component system, chemotaxis family, CheB/CheR fusion protein